MIRFASHVIPVGQLFPNADKKQKFVKVAMGIGLSMLTAGLGEAVDKLASKLHEKWAEGTRAMLMAKGAPLEKFKDDGENIPAEIVVDLANKEMNESIHISSVKLPDGAKPVISDRDFTIATIAAPTVVKEPEPAAAAAGDAAAGDTAAPAEGGTAAAGDAKAVDGKAKPGEAAKSPDAAKKPAAAAPADKKK